jgi:transcriptional repressor NrdR
MRCPQCTVADTKVVESRDVGEGEAIRRRRECLGCAHRYTTYERVERPHLIVIKSDGTRQSYNRDKIRNGMHRACEKTTVTSNQIESMVSVVENKVFALGEPEVMSRDIGQQIMDELARVNEVAYVRFASVYRRFKDLASFEKELELMKSRHSLDSQKA